MTLKRTPLYASHQALKARLVPFAGYEMPVQYSGVLDETKAVRSKAGLFDVSHMGQFRVTGKNPLAAVQSLVTNDLSKLKHGQAQYNMLCNEKGGVIDDLIVYHYSDAETFICVNAGNKDIDLEWMRSHLPAGASLADESAETALIAVQGPESEALLGKIASPGVAEALTYYWAAPTQLFNEFPCYLSRTGYTGEDGFELYISEKHAAATWDRLLEMGRPHGLIPCGLGARDSLRLEMGYPLHGHELSTEISPLEAGLGWVVKTEIAADYIGKAALKKQRETGVTKKLTGFTVQDKRSARQGYPIVNGNHATLGEITSGTFSPHVGAPIAMGFVPPASLEGGTFFALVRGEAVPMKATKLPFVPSHTKAKPKG